MEVRGYSETAADQREESGDRVDDENGGERVPGARRKGEVAVVSGGKEAICGVADANAAARLSSLAVAQHTEIYALEVR